MTAIPQATTYPSATPAHRRADIAVHAIGLTLILAAGLALSIKASADLDFTLIAALGVYILCVLASNIASSLYHFGPWHHRRVLLRRIDHAAIYPSITGTFTPFFVQAGTSWTWTLLYLCWGLTALAIWNKITNENVKSRWSTASYLGLGALGLGALPDLTMVPATSLWCILSGVTSFVIGTGFYARKTLPFRYAIWHMWVNIGGILMFTGIWIALF
ncbi:PAQR family membrane homeostasis protein TrhA [Pseudophaeobacter arcticus]|uniref:PAQR family membrane homeostasis protein TrhA n=1 Tax=Pseudophaeobacter arcticus TaxID=385492 RepID=UPI0024903330|nr:hemolysin III family protein [Pseudophaeobacter arcticus]